MEESPSKRAPERWPDEGPFLETASSLERAGRIEELIRLYEARVRELPVPAEAARLLTRAGELARDRIKDFARAEDFFRRALLFAPGSKEPLKDLSLLLEQKQDHASLAELLEVIARSAAGRERAALLLKAADLYEHKLQRKERAILCCQQASKADPSAKQAFRRSRLLFLSEHRYRLAFDSLQRERAALGDAGLAEDYAALAEQLADDPLEHPLAQDAARIALEIQPGISRAEKVLRALKQFDLSWRDRVRLLRTASLEERDRKRAARLSLLVAKLFAWCDGAARGKVKEALDRSLLLWPGMPEAIDFMERLAAKEKDLPSVMRFLEVTAGETKDRAVESQLWTRAGLLRLRLDDRAAALSDFLKAAEADPSRGEGAGLAAELLIENERPAEAFSLYERYLGTLRDRQAQIEVRTWLAELGASLGRPETRAHLEAVLKLDRTNARAAWRLARLMVGAKESEGLDQVLELALLSTQSPKERIQLALEAASLFEEKGDPGRAFSVLARTYFLEPADEQLASALVASARRSGPQPEITASLRRAAQLAPESASTELRRGLAELVQSSAGDGRSAGNGAPSQAAGPGDANGRPVAAASKTEDLERSANAMIAASRWDEAARAIEALLEALGGNGGGAAFGRWQVTLAQLYCDRLSRPDDGVALLLQLLQTAPAPEVLSSLERMAARGIRPTEISEALAKHHGERGDHQRQVASLLIGLSSSKHPDHQKEILRALAGIHEKHLADTRMAFDFLVRALSLDPLDEELRAEATRLARDLSAQADLSRALVTSAAAAEPAAARELLRAAADLAEEAGAIDAAVSALQSALERSPDDPAILSRLAELYRKAGSLAECDQVLRRRILIGDDGEKAGLYLQLSRLSAEMSRPLEAARALQEAIRAGADEAQNLPLLCEFLEKAGRVTELSAALGRGIELATAAGHKDEAARLSLKRAKVLEASSNDRAEAVRNYSEILRRRPSDPDALAALESLLRDPQCREDAARALAPAYETLKDHRKLVVALDIVSQTASDPLEKVLALKQAAYVYLHQLRQPDLAFAALARALRLSPGDATIRSAARQAAEDADSLDSLAEVLAEMLDEDVGTARYALHRELADLYEKKLDNRKGAVRHLREALKLGPGNLEVLRALQRLHRIAEEWAALAEVVETLAVQVPDSAEKIALWRDAALLHEQKLMDKESAAEAYRQIASRDPLDREAAITLERLGTELGRSEDLALALGLRVAQEGQSPQGREAAYRLAQLRQRLGDESGALQLYREILGGDPNHAGTRAALEAWAKAGTAESSSALELLDPVLGSSGEHARRIALRELRMESALPQEKARLAAEIRTIYEVDMRQPDLAFRAALKAFAAGPDQEVVRLELERLARATGAYDDLADAYESAAEVLLPGDDTIPVLLRRAADLREHLGQADQAIALWRALLEEDPHDREALDHLGNLYERSRNAKSLSEVFARKAQLAEDPEERHAFLLKAGAAFEASGEAANAIEAFRSALAIRKTIGALEGLDRLYGKSQRPAEQADVLDLLAEMSSDPGARKVYLARRAQLLEKEGQHAAALTAYRQVLELSPGDGSSVSGLERLLQVDSTKAEAARLLEPIYRNLKDVRRLVEVIEVRAASAPPGQRFAAVQELANLRELLGQKSIALQARIRALREEPENPGAREELERLAAETGSFQELAATYEEHLARGVSDALATDLWRRLGALYADRLARPDLAVRAWEEVAKREPSNAQPLESLARLYRETRAFRELADVMKRQIALEPVERKQVSYLFELGRLAEEGLSDRALAAWAYSQVLDRQPEDANALKSLEKVLSQSERWPELATLMEREIRLAEQRGAREESFDLRVRLGRLKLSRLSDPRGALDTFQEVLTMRSGHPGAIGALEEMARSDSPLRGDAAAALEPVFTDAGDHLRLVQMLESRASAEPELKERIALLRRVAEVYASQMNNAEMAFVAAARALRELPDDEASLELCLKLVEPADAAEDLATLLTHIATKAADDGARASLYRALARLRLRQRDLEGALDTWKKVLELRAGDDEALDAMARLYAQLGRARELLDVLRRQIAATDDSSRRALLLLQIGTLQDEHLKDGMGALSTFRRLLELCPDDRAALERMDLLTQKLQRWPELADVLSRRIKLEGKAASPDLMFRLAGVRESRLMDKLGALQLYAEILAARPDHADTVAKLASIVQKEPQNEGAVSALIQALRATRDGPKLAEVLELRIGVSPDAGERKALLIELAEIRKAQSEPELEYLALYRAFKEDPNDDSLRGQLESAAEAAAMQEELAHAYEEELPRIVDAADAAGVCVRLAVLFEEKLDHLDRAVLYYEKARELAPDIAPRVLPSLDRLYTQLGKPEELAGILETLADRAQDPEEKIAFLFRLGQIAHEPLANPERAVAAYERILELNKAHAPAARQLEQLYELAGNTDKLYAVLRLQRANASGQERERILSKMAQVSAEGLSDVGQSIDLYRELLLKNPRNESAYASLEELLERAERFEELRDLLAARVRQAIEPRELARANDKLGRVLHRRLGRGEESIPFFKAALERDPRHKPALESLREVYTELGRKDELVAVLRRLLPLQDDNDGIKAVRIQLSELLGEMGRREEALDAGRRAMEIEPHLLADLNRVHRVFASLKAHADAVRALELRSEVELVSDQRDQAVATLFEIAELWKGPAHKPESAGPPLLKILELDPANRTAYEGVRDLFAELSDWRAYAELVDRYLPQVVTDEEKIALLRELAKIREQKLGQKDAAFLAICRALQLDPADDHLREEVERLADATGSHEELAAVYEQVADDLPRSPLAERIYLALAKIQDQRLDDPTSAEASLRKILEFDPTDAPALEAMAQMFSRRGRDQEYVVVLEQKVEATGATEERKRLLHEIARVYEERLSDPGEAAGALIRALDLEPDPHSFGLLISFFKRQKAWVDVAHTLLRSRDLAATAEERARIQLEVAQVYERELEEDEQAAAAYREALELDPNGRDALEALERLYIKLDRPAELLAIYDRQLELSSDYRERVKVLFKSAAIWEDKFQNLANADACIEGVLAIDSQNLQAIRGLERLRRSQGRWEELVSVIERHIQLCTSAEEQSDLSVAIGDVFHQHLKQVDRAAKQYDRALELNPQNLHAMHGLGTVYERSGNWPFALEMLQREAEVIGPNPESAELHYRMGKINEEMLQDISTAKACYLEALRILPSYLPSLRALKGIHEAEGDWDAFEKALIAEAQYTEDPEAKGKALIEVAGYFAEKKEDLETASRWYEEALRLVPDSFEAAARLADIYVGRESWGQSERMLDIAIAQMTDKLAAGHDDAVAKELCRQLYRLGYVTEKLGNKQKALTSYERAYRLDATYLPALEGLGNLLVQSGRLEEALKVYQTILIHHREDLTDLEVVEIYWQLGDIHSSLQQTDRAQNHFEKALSIDPGHEPSLRALVKIAEDAQRFDKSAEYRQSLLTVLEDDAKFENSVELGNLAREKLNDDHMAIDAYIAAHKIRPDSLPVMDALYVLYRQTRQGQKAAEILERMLAQPELQQDPQRAKRVYFALGEICRDELNEVDRSVAAFNSALDLDHRFVEAFSAIESLLSAQKQWKLLEENYVRMIQRIPKTDDTHVVRMALWRALGDLYVRVLKNPDSAFMAYQVAAAGLPDDAAVQEAYAELAAQKPGQEDKAVAAYRRALPNTAHPAKVCSALAELGARSKNYDLAYLAAQAAQGFFGEDGPGEREILSKLTPYAKKREIAQQPLNDRLWKMHLLHPKIRGPISELMAILFEQVGHHLAVPLSQYQINPKKHRIDVPTAQEYQIHHYRYVARLLGLEAVELYSPFLVATRDRLNKKSNDPVPDPLIGIEICQTHPVGLRIGGKFFSEPGQREVYYLLGRTLALLRPELALSQRVAPARLEALFQAAITLSVSDFRFTVDRRAIDFERGLLQRSLAEPARVALDRASREYLRAGPHTSFSDYLQGAEMTASRTGLFVAADVDSVKKMVHGETGAAYHVGATAKLRDLVTFAVSEDLHALRAAVGNRVEVQLRR
jgi:tetratricopeptide (TPR) repeat protein